MVKNSDDNLGASAISYFFIVIAIIGVWIPFLNNVRNGEIYAGLTLLGVVLLFLTDRYYPNIKKLNPFAKDFNTAIVMFWFGVLLVILLNVILPQSYKIFEINRPFVLYSATGANLIGQTFNVISIELSDFWIFFFVVIAAGTLETFLFSHVAIRVGQILSRILIKLGVTKGILQKANEQRIAELSIAMLISISTFAVAHLFNSSYTTSSMFILALVFKLLMNLAIYYARFGFMFATGFHQANNFFASISVTGFAVVRGLFSPFGFIFVVLYLLMLYYTVRNVDKIPKIFKNLITGFGRNSE